MGYARRYYIVKSRHTELLHTEKYLTKTKTQPKQWLHRRHQNTVESGHQLAGPRLYSEVKCSYSFITKHWPPQQRPEPCTAAHGYCHNNTTLIIIRLTALSRYRIIKTKLEKKNSCEQKNRREKQRVSKRNTKMNQKLFFPLISFLVTSSLEPRLPVLRWWT